MRIVFLAVMMSAVLSGTLSAQTATSDTNTAIVTNAVLTKTNISAQELFKSVRLKNLEQLPAVFTAEIKGRAIESKMTTIPKESYLNKNKRVFTQFIYSKKTGISIEVQNVEDLYKGLYKDLARQFFAFDLILSSEKNDHLLSKYKFSYDLQTPDLTILKLGIKNADNNLKLYVTPDSLRIMRVDYFVGKDLLSSTMIGYKEVSNGASVYTLPETFMTKTFSRTSGDSRPEQISFSGFTVTPATPGAVKN